MIVWEMVGVFFGLLFEIFIVFFYGFGIRGYYGFYCCWGIGYYVGILVRYLLYYVYLLYVCCYYVGVLY